MSFPILTSIVALPALGALVLLLVRDERNESLMRAWFNADYTGRFGSSQAIFKAALNELGLPGGYPRRPLLPLEEHGLSIVRQTLISLGKLNPQDRRVSHG